MFFKSLCYDVDTHNLLYNGVNFIIPTCLYNFIKKVRIHSYIDYWTLVYYIIRPVKSNTTYIEYLK